jgi:ABC-2 type transport system permease protein
MLWLLPVMKLLLADAIFLIICLALLILLSRFKHATFSVMKRNLFGYFSSPTGYVFICLFVVMASYFAFWPHEFFNANLATLGELNKNFPLVMLLFIPTITMSIWAEERRQGTDELLLTIPATDWDIVLGKYLAAAAIFTVSLLFSQLANFFVLNILAVGDVDTGLFISTYIGYWLIGLAMLAIGMAASFLTSNLTVGFILGVLFNAPLVMAAKSDQIFRSADVAQMISRWSYGAQFEDFGRGVISFKSLVFFGMVACIGLYLSIVLIGRRHWWGGKDGQSMLGHYIIRTIALVVLAFAANLFFSHYDLFRQDMTSEQISSLSPDTVRLLNNLEPKHSILVEAFISKTVPETYAKTKVDLITMLNELRARGGQKINVRVYDNLATFSDNAARAEKQYGIEPSTVLSRDRGAIKQEEIFMGAAFTSGLEKVVVPFFDLGTPVEYEIIRSINTVAQADRKRLGVVRTDAELFGGFDFRFMQPRPRQLIIEELEKQYEVVEVDPNNPIEEFDVLLAVQPSSLTPPQLENFIDAVRRGQPTAIFEDPFPIALSTAPGTGQPKRPRGGGMFGGGQPPEPKGDIQRLWSMLGITMVGQPGFGSEFDAQIVWQNYNPYPKVRGFQQITPEWVFASPDAPGAKNPINPESPITSGLTQILLLYPGAVKHEDGKDLDFTPLVATGNQTGTISYQALQSSQQQGFMSLAYSRQPTADRFVLASIIQGSVKEDAAEADVDAPANSDGTQPNQQAGDGNGEVAADQDASSAGGEDEVKVVFVTDIDLLHDDFLRLRARPDTEINWQFDNVTFVLNILDILAGDDRLVEVRKRKTRHSTLRMVDLATEDARTRFAEEKARFDSDFENAKAEAESNMNVAIQEFQDKLDQARNDAKEAGQQMTGEVQRLMMQLAMKQQVEQRRLETTTARQEKERDANLKQIEQDLNQAVLRVQNQYKAAALLLPPIPPLLVGAVVFWRRRQRESEGVSRDRRR